MTLVQARCRKCGELLYNGPDNGRDMADAIARHATEKHGLGPGATIGLDFRSPDEVPK